MGLDMHIHKTQGNNIMEGYKVFEPDWTCKGFQYEVGKTFEEDVTPSCCNRGFHFCKELKDCFNYYPFNPDNKVAKIIALGELDEKPDGSKCCTNKIQIVEEIGWEDVLRMVNLGKENTGLCNSGDCNSGYCNSGNRNSGNRNSGNRNSGDCNSGDWNSGDYNSGDWNSGKCNSGDYNSGYCNSGNRNSGNWNSGKCNSGNRNSGNHNSGNYNSGDWNNTNFSSGCFNTQEPKILLFNKPSDWTYRDWLHSDAKLILDNIPDEICDENIRQDWWNTLPDDKKEIITSRQDWWNTLPDDKKEIITSLQNFDSEIFYECTGIKI